MSRQSALAAGRRFALGGMTDAGRALRPTGDGKVYDPELGAEVEATEEVLAAPCMINPPRTAERESEVGGRTLVEIPGELHLPASPENASLRVGDFWEITDVGDQSLTIVGRRYRITGESDGTAVTACRYSIDREAT